jgi:cellulose synthase/poly-beta-1,6-N-acetylglucosamine synthase-like glycosyltransferase
LNLGVREARGEIIGVFDADSVPAPDVLLNVCKYFDEPTVAAVQGRTMSINRDQNMLTKFISYEDAVWCEAYLRGKDALDLFVHLRGTCQFVRRGVLADLGNFDEGTLSEDMELSARLTEKGYRIRYGSDVCSLQESPSVLKTLLRQRVRWCRGIMEVAFRYGRLMAKPSRKNVDAEATLFAPVILIASLLTYLAASYLVFVPSSLGLLMSLATRIAFLSMTLTLILGSLALIYASKPRRVSSVLWLPFVYFYYVIQTLIAMYAVGLIVLRRPRRWVKTEKTGAINVDGSVTVAGQRELEKFGNRLSQS